VRRNEVKREEFFPSVTFIVTVHNEQGRIRDKLENTLSLDYPRNKVQILVASDGSTDLTNEIVRGYVDRGVQLLAFAERQGKEGAQKQALDNAHGDIIVFTDVATAMQKGGLRQLVSNFFDPTVGCVSSEDRLMQQDGKPSGEGLYVRYEMWLRALESRANSVVGVSGSLFAARKAVCKDFSGEMQSDFRTVLNCVRMGLRAISDPLTIGVYQDIEDQKREWDRKIRTVVRGLTVFFRHTELLDIGRFGLFSYQLFCHKLLRWSAPLFLTLALLFNLFLINDSFIYHVLLILQVLFYGFGVLGVLLPTTQRLTFVRVPAYFLAVNASVGVAWWRYLMGERILTWLPTKR